MKWHQHLLQRTMIPPVVILLSLSLVALVQDFFEGKISEQWPSIQREKDSTTLIQLMHEFEFDAERLVRMRTLLTNDTTLLALIAGNRSNSVVQYVESLLPEAHSRAFAVIVDSTIRPTVIAGTIPEETVLHESTGLRKFSDRYYLISRTKFSSSEAMLVAGIQLAEEIRTSNANSRFVVSSVPQQTDLSAPFVFDHDTVAFVLVEPTDKASYLEQVRNGFSSITHFLLIALFAATVIIVFQKLRKLRSVTVKYTLFVLLLIAIRYCLLWTNSLSILSPDSLLDPVHYASSFGEGIAGNLLELSVSSLFILVISVVLVRGWNAIPLRLPSPALSVMFVAILGATAALTLRGFIATLRSIVMDSTFIFTDTSLLFRDAYHVLAVWDILILSASFAMLINVPAILSNKLIVNVDARYRTMALTAAAFIGTSTVLGISSDVMIPAFIYFLVVIGVFLGARYSRATPTSKQFVLISGWCLSLLATFSLEHFSETRAHQELEVFASDLAKPADGWSESLVSQTLLSAQFSTPEFHEVSYPYLHRIWKESALSNQPNNSACVLLPLERAPLRFSMGIPPRDVDAIIDSINRWMNEQHPPKVLQLHGRRYHLGTTNLEDSTTLLIIVQPYEPLASAGVALDVLRTPSAVPSPTARRMVVSFSSAGSIMNSTQPDVVTLQSHVQRAPHSPWGTIKSEEALLRTYFIPVAGDTSKSLAVSLTPEPQHFPLFRFFRFSGLSLASFLIVAFAAHLIRQRKRSMTFERKLQLILLFIAFIPLTIIWITIRAAYQENSRIETAAQLNDRLNILEQFIRDNVLASPSDSLFISNAGCYEIARKTGHELTAYRDAFVASASRPELYHANILSSAIHPAAFTDFHLKGRNTSVISDRIGLIDYSVGYRAIRNEAGKLLAIISTPTLFRPDRNTEAYVQASTFFLVGGVIIILLVLFLSRLIAKQISRPLQELTTATQRIAEGNLHLTVSPGGSLEIRQLADSFNTMTRELEQSRAELASAERELAWKEMARQVAHEIRNPLTPMKLAAQHLQKAAMDEAPNLHATIKEITATIIEQIDALSRISDEFSRFGRMPKRNLAQVDIASLLREAVGLFQHHQHVAIVLELREALPAVHADREELARAFTNILRNSTQAIHDEGKIFVTARKDSGNVIIVIRDTGTGIDEALLPRIFEPNFSTKTEGMGLGLPIVKKILDDIHGSISLESEAGSGTVVTITLPIISAH